jgi:hypothetical protein
VLLQRLPVLKRRSLSICVFVTAITAVLSGCGKNFYPANRTLPPSGLTNRVLVGVQNPSPLSTGTLQFVDAFYDVRHNFNDSIASFSISGYSGKPDTIQNMPEEQIGGVYNSNDGSFTLVDYATEKVSSTISASGTSASLNGLSSSIFTTRNQAYIFAANQAAHILTVVDRTAGRTYSLNLPGVYRVSVNPGGTVALAFTQNGKEAYFVRRLQTGEPAPINVTPGQADGDCEPQNNPIFCALPLRPNSNGSAGAQSIDQSSNDSSPLSFNYPIKALFSPDGSSVYVLNCAAECGQTGVAASVTILPTAPLIIQSGQETGLLPASPTNIQIPAGASNGVFNGSTLYLAGQQQQSDGLWAGNLTVLNTNTQTIAGTYSISDGTPGKMLVADDNTLWIGTVSCTNGERFKNGSPYGCLTMFNISNNSVTVDSYKGDLTGIAGITGLHKVYVAEGGQLHIYTTSFAELDNSQVTVTGTAYDVAYMDGLSDDNNTTY